MPATNPAALPPAIPIAILRLAVHIEGERAASWCSSSVYTSSTDLMNRLVYRNFGDHEALLVSHAVTAGTGGGIRWYELRNPATTLRIFQQGTYAPDSAFRWMSSMAFDSAGNIGLGFSISSSTINPSIRYTGRLVTDASGTMGQGEATIVAGTGSQTESSGFVLSRWGDYSSMNIDPTDDCTFWYTQEYMAEAGAFNWHTRIGAFTFRFDNTFSAMGLPITISDLATITSPIPVTSTGTVVSLFLSVSITHTFRGDLIVKLISPDGTEFNVSNREGDSADNIILANFPYSVQRPYGCRHMAAQGPG
jgi:hypothetical protein